MTTKPDKRELRQNLDAVFRQVATAPDKVDPFEIGRTLAERLGYPSTDLDRLPSEAVDSFAGVGYHIGDAVLHRRVESHASDAIPGRHSGTGV